MNTTHTFSIRDANKFYDETVKRQKLEGGKTRQIMSIETKNLSHKTRPGVVNGSSKTSTPSTAKSRKMMYFREPAPFVSMTEMMRKFQSGKRDLNLPPRGRSCTTKKTKLTLTRPKEPEFVTSWRVRSVKIKSSAELEEEMMAKVPKFKARPMNKKIFEAPMPPTIKRSTPKIPEFHLKTMKRANQNAEIEELEKAPKFKARPLNKKILESKGELGLFCNTKRQVTGPQEFLFVVDERIPPEMANVNDLFDKLSLTPIPKNTTPNPFHLHTEERGAEKEKKFVMEVLHKQVEEERARVPKSNPYPCTTDYPVVPPKPEPMPCTKLEPFELASLVRHEEEIQREMEGRKTLEEEEARMRLFKAQPILKEDPIPLPKKVRKPLTEVQGFDLHGEHRAVDRVEFDKKLKEKEMTCKRYRDEAESAKMMEEEKAVKQLRRTLIPRARPVPNFNKPFIPHKSSKGVTKAKSPRLQIIERKERRKMIVAATTSIAPSNMR